MSFQQAMNGTATVHYGTPICRDPDEFHRRQPRAVGGVAGEARGGGRRQPAAGGVVVLPWRSHGLHVRHLCHILVRSLGVLLAGIGMIAGQLLGSLALDAWFPVPGTLLAPATVLGTLLAMAALLLATVPAPRRRAGLRSRAAEPSGTGAAPRT